MPDLTAALLDRMIRTIVDEVDPEQVILFGSRARGDARPDSDVDLLIIESEPFGDGRSARAESARLNQALAATPVATDLLVYSREEIDRWRGSPFVQNVLQYGRRKASALRLPTDFQHDLVK